MAGLATKTFLSHLKSLYPFPYNRISRARESFANPWDFIAAVAFSNSNAPEAIPLIWEYALEDLHKTHIRLGQAGDSELVRQDRLVLARRLRDAIFKGGITGGYAKACLQVLISFIIGRNVCVVLNSLFLRKAINGLMALHEVVPPELRDKEMLRSESNSLLSTTRVQFSDARKSQG
jgi:endoribonuclease Dicer